MGGILASLWAGIVEWEGGTLTLLTRFCYHQMCWPAHVCAQSFRRCRHIKWNLIPAGIISRQQACYSWPWPEQQLDRLSTQARSQVKPPKPLPDVAGKAFLPQVWILPLRHHLPSWQPLGLVRVVPLFKCYLTLLFLFCAVCGTHKTSHSCCQICGLNAYRLFKATVDAIRAKIAIKNFTLIWLNGFTASDICSFVYGPKCVDFIALLLVFHVVVIYERSVFGPTFPLPFVRFVSPLLGHPNS